MSEFRPAVRQAVRLIIGLAGGTGSGKTWSSLVLAKGMADGKRFGLVDTENGRASMYADYFDFDVLDLSAPFTSQHYLDAIKKAEKAGYPVVVVDQFSHEWEGDGGILDQQEHELAEMIKRSKASGDTRPDYQLEESHKMRAWVGPKTAHKRMMTHLTHMDCQLIINFRAEDKIEMAKEKDGSGKMKTVIRPKKSLIGVDGWIPICERRMPFELTASFLLTAEAPGVPKPIKLQEQHKTFFPLDKPITEEAGRQLAAWARGGSPAPKPELSEDEVRDLLIAIEAAESIEQLKVYGERAKLAPVSSQQMLRDLYAVVQKKLKQELTKV